MRIWKWMLVALILITVLPVSTAKAENQVELSVDLALGGIVKYSQWTQIIVTMTNHGEAFAGQLELGEKEGARHGTAVLSQSMQIGAGETKQLAFTIPGESLQQMSPGYLRVKKEGKEVGKKELPQVRYADSNVIAVLDGGSNTFHFLAGSSIDESQRQRYSVERLNPQLLPEESWLYKNIDALAVGNLPNTALSAKQTAALKEWVKRGGVLILFAGEKGNGIIPAFASELGLGAGAPAAQTQLDEIRKLSGKASLSVDSLPVYDSRKPLFISRESGDGLLLFANYDIGAEPFASWQYNRDLWRAVFSKYKVLERFERSNYQFAVDGTLLRLSQNIPDVKTPWVGTIILIWSIYLIVLAPCLYWGLKKLDRREWAWGIIPISAVLLTVGVYLVGRPFIVSTDTAFHVNTIDIADDQFAEVQTASSFLAVMGGTFDVRSMSAFQTVPISNHRNGGMTASGICEADHNDNTMIRYENVPYLSIRQATAMGVKTGIGSFASKLSIEQNRIKGTVTNHTIYPMDELYIQLGRQRIDLGAAKPGETKQVDALLANNYLSQQDFSAGRDQQKRTDAERIKELKDAIADGGQVGIRLVGINQAALPVMEMEKPHRAHYWNVFHENVTLLPSSTGRIVYPYGTLPIDDTKDAGNVNYRDGMWVLEKGSLTFTLAVNRAPFTPEKVEIPFDQSVYHPFKKAIFRAKTGKWEELDKDQPLTLEQNLNDYLTIDGKLLIRFSNDTNTPLSMPEPFFQVEGVEN
ncbi:hypothetical protein ACTID9_16250 [Brevibacillus fluminis]|uniref:hypothetical protein n=1 Tax=Brevibacillus fluminis TaxID=511487 RepID=UPI003F8C9F6D